MKSVPRIEIEHLIDQGEDQAIEFKTSFGKEAIETVVAFSNSEGGRILIGVSNHQGITGISLSPEIEQQWLNAIKQNTSPSVFPDIEYTSVAGKTVAVITVKEFPVKPISIKGKYFIRRANSNHKMTLTEITNAYLKTYNLSWDAYEKTDSSVDDLDEDKILTFIEDVNRIGRFSLDQDPILALQKLRLINNNGPTNASILMFGKNDTPYNIHIGRFKESSVIISDWQSNATLFEQIDLALEQIKTYLNIAFDFDGSIQRVETWDYPLEVVRELLVNAVVHRDYMSPSDIIIKVFDDHIQFTNPGRLLEGLSISDLENDNYSSVLRNKLIAESFYLAGRIEKYGSGFVRIREILKKRQDVTIQFDDLSSGFSITCKKSLLKTQPKTQPKIASTKGRILAIVRDNPQVSQEDLSKQLHKNISTIKQHFKELTDKGIVKRVGGKKGGYWEVID